MSYQIFHSYDLEDSSITNFEFDMEEPRLCMHCNTTGIQVRLGCFATLGEKDIASGIALYSCQLCGSTTIHLLARRGDHMDPSFRSVDTIPAILEDHPDIPSHFKENFPSFYKIYKQSHQAELEDLDQIAGMGYRKALEFLVTDYLLKYPVENVKSEWLTNPKTTLGNKISKIPSERIKKLSRAISFLGNDETHYTKQHPEHDINSIKAFIRALVSEIQNEIEFQRAEELLNKPRA